MSTSRKRRKRKKPSSSSRKASNRESNRNTNSPQSPQPKFIASCRELLNQITGFHDSKPFHKMLSTEHQLYKEYIKLNSNPISFKTIQKRLIQKPCHYANYDAFNEDIGKIFYQEKRLKNYKGNSDDTVKNRMQSAKRTENYWNTIIAPITQYGFDAIYNNNNNTNDTDDSKEEFKSKRIKKNVEPKESQKERRDKKILSNIKKRVKRGDGTSELEPPPKRRKIHDDKADRERILSQKEEKEEDEDAKKEMDEDFNKNKKMNTPRAPRVEYKERNDVYMNVDDKDTPFTPFAEKSHVFNEVMGDTDGLFKNMAHLNSGTKKRLNFGGNIEDDNKNEKVKVYTFEIKWRYNDGLKWRYKEPQWTDIEAPRLDAAVKKFKSERANIDVKILSVQLKST